MAQNVDSAGKRKPDRFLLNVGTNELIFGQIMPCGLSSCSKKDQISRVNREYQMPIRY